MNKKMHKGLSWLEFSLLAPFREVGHACLQKEGGFSPQPFDSLSFSVASGDTKRNVQKNIEKVKQVFELKQIILLHLEHKDNVLVLDQDEDVKWFLQHKPVADAVITHLVDVALMVTHADCQAILLYDPVKKVIGAIHAGWRGNVINIMEKTIKKMEIHYHCDPKNIHACISPSLGPNAAQFIHADKEFPEDFFAFEWKEHYFNLWDLSYHQCLNAGLLPGHIEVARICTYENPHFFSYRRNKITGRNASFVHLKNI